MSPEYIEREQDRLFREGQRRLEVCAICHHCRSVHGGFWGSLLSCGQECGPFSDCSCPGFVKDEGFPRTEVHWKQGDTGARVALTDAASANEGKAQ